MRFLERNERAIAVMALLTVSCVCAAYAGQTYEGSVVFPASIPAVGEFEKDHGHALLSADGAEPGVLDATAASGTIDAPLTDLVFDTDETTVSGTRADAADPSAYLPAESATVRYAGAEVTYWKDRQLSDIKSVRAIIRYHSGDENSARACYFQNDGTTASVQFQTRMENEEQYVICVKVAFRQVDKDITARVVFVRYVNTTTYTPATDEAHDFEVKGGNLQYVYDGNLSVSGYGLRAILAGEAGSEGKGGKGLKIAGRTRALTPVGGATTLPRWPNTKVADIEGLVGEIHAAGSWSVPVTACCLKRSEDGQTLSAWIERYADDGGESGKAYVVLGKIVCQQDGDDVTVSWTASGYRYLSAGDDVVVPYDADSKPYASSTFSYAVRNLSPILKRGSASATVNGRLDVSGNLTVSDGTAQFGTAALTMSAGTPALVGDGHVRFYRDVTDHPLQGQSVHFAAGGKNHTGATVFDGSEAFLTNTYALTAKWPVILQNDALVHLQIPGEQPLGETFLQIHVGSGSTLKMEKSYNLRRAHVFLDDGTLQLDSSLRYLDHVTLKDGSRIAGSNTFRINGYDIMFPTIASLGTTPSEIAIRIEMYGHHLSKTTARANGFIRFYTEADLLVSGGLVKAGDADYQAVRVWKGGAATLTLSGENTHTARWEVVAGTLKFAAANAVTEKNGVRLLGGNLATTAPVACDYLETGASAATLTVGAGGSLTLAGADDLVLGEGGLVIDATPTAEGILPVRVGTAAVLSAGQRSRMRFRRPDGSLAHVRQRADGYLTVCGSLMLILK